MKATRVCKICGKKYDYCMSSNPTDNIFRWQDVACCKEHGMEYFDRIKKSRSKTKPEDTKKDMHTDVKRRNNKHRKNDSPSVEEEKLEASIETDSVPEDM